MEVLVVMNIAIHVISKIGGGGESGFARGVALICAWTGLLPVAVYKWTYPKEKGGTGGHIPSWRQGTILACARASGIALMPADFFDPADLMAVNDNASSALNNMVAGDVDVNCHPGAERQVGATAIAPDLTAEA
jgi:hypothetical protein